MNSARLSFSFLFLLLINLIASADWSETIDCYFIANNTKSVQLICDTNSTQANPNDNCHSLLFKESSKDERRAELKVLKASGCRFVDVDTAFNEIIANLSELDNSFSHVDNFLYFPLWKFDNLEKWNLSHNSLIQVWDDYFSAAPRLIEIDLSYNQIRGIDTLGFKGVFHLKAIDLSHNHIDNLNKGTFKDHNELKELNLSFNHLVKISSNAFPIDKNIEFLWFDKEGNGNVIQYINRPSEDSIAVRIFGNDEEDANCNCTTSETNKN